MNNTRRYTFLGTTCISYVSIYCELRTETLTSPSVSSYLFTRVVYSLDFFHDTLLILTYESESTPKPLLDLVLPTRPILVHFFPPLP